MKYIIDSHIKKQIDILVERLHFDHIIAKQIYCIRSYDVKTRAYARIWGMSPIFKEVAKIEPTYIIEVNNKQYEKLTQREKIKTLIHELMHIPKTFSGALLSHRGRYHRINDREVEKIMREFTS